MPIKTVCPMDCQDLCAIQVQLDPRGRLYKITGDPLDPLTRGWLCAKGKAYHERVYHPQRLLHPLLKINGYHQKISWEDAYNIILDKLTQFKKESGSLSILHYQDAGSANILKNIPRRFFNAFGGVTTTSGSLCWSAGIAAQLYDFGQVFSHSANDLMNSDAIVAWGRNLPSTNQHTWSQVVDRINQGTKLVVISPLPTQMDKKASLVLRPKPGTDGALALAICHLLNKNNAINLNDLEKKAVGIRGFIAELGNYSPAWAAEITHISPSQIEALAEIYSLPSPTATLLGYGLQRYANSGQTIRAIDAVVLLSGNTGRKGGGANYANSKYWALGKALSGDNLANFHRQIPCMKLGTQGRDLRDPKLRCVFFTCSNLVAQGPARKLTEEFISSLEFVCVVDHFMTSTAKLADLVLPATTFYEEEGIVAKSWNHSLHYSPQIIAPLGECKSDQEIFTDLARRLHLDNFGPLSPNKQLSKALEIYTQGKISLEDLKKSPMQPSLKEAVPFRDLFGHTDGKYHLFSAEAQKDGFSPYPQWEPASSQTSANYPFILLTPHAKQTLNSQSFACEVVKGDNTTPIVLVHSSLAAQLDIAEGDLVNVITHLGFVTAKCRLSATIFPECVSIETAWQELPFFRLNDIIDAQASRMGSTAAFYDTPCRIEPAKQ